MKLELLRKNYVIFAILLTFLIAVVLSWIGYERLAAFRQYHRDISHSSAIGVEKQVAPSIAEKNHMVAIFAMEHLELIRALAKEPNNDDLHDKLSKLLKLHFPDNFAFSVADKKGIPRFEDFDGFVSQLCLADLKQFASTRKPYLPYIHPNSEGYHYDVMVIYGEPDVEGIFFVSFLADYLGGILKSIETPGHQLMLIYPQRTDLIEVVATGARNHVIRNDYRLSDAEKNNIVMRHDIEGTRWQVVDFHDPALFVNYRNNIIKESAFILTIFIFVAGLFVIRLRKEERQRELAEHQREALMGVISHEFRSPASIIKSALDIIRDGDAGEVSDDVKKYIDMAENNTSRLLYLVNDFLDLQKMEAGQLKFDKTKNRLGDVVEKAIDDNKLYVQQLGSSMVLAKPMAEDSVLCDANRIEQVLTNLITNAVKYGKQNDVIEVAIKKRDGNLRASVTDHGPGIPEAFQAQVFEKFAMAHAQQNQKHKSSGLGLSISQAIVEQHGGSIGFETEVDAGTTFWFELPIVD
jgi:signal transduction histidine kinase